MASPSSRLLLLLSCLALALLAADAEVHHHEFVVRGTA
jgi:laccase